MNLLSSRSRPAKGLHYDGAMPTRLDQTMSPSQIYEPTYRAIKQRLLTGFWPAGMRLEAARIAADLQVSASPVRDCLNRLAGERMIEARAREGFHVPHYRSQTLRDLFGLNLALLLSSLASDRPDLPDPCPDQGHEDHAARTASAFHHIAQRSGNAELITMVENLNDRLHLVRQVEEIVLPHPTSELDAIESKWEQPGSAAELRSIVRHYHRRRQRAAPRLEQAIPAI